MLRGLGELGAPGCKVRGVWREGGRGGRGNEARGEGGRGGGRKKRVIREAGGGGGREGGREWRKGLNPFTY